MKYLQQYLYGSTSIAGLAVFRLLFGFIMLVSLIRFAAKGWIHELYIRPDYFFTFYGFEWVKPLGPSGMYAIFLLMGLSALLIMLGLFYRYASVLFFLSFTYVELIDKTNYLNHYYFVSIISFLLILVPAHRYFSLDVLRRPALLLRRVPVWTINIFKLQLGIVYIYAGLAKLNYDWLFNAMPLKIWLPAQSHLPVIGPWLNEEWVPYLFSWSGALYDLFIVFFLLNRSTRAVAYLAVIIFHLMTGYLFQIGMFPYIMILSTLIFFPAGFHEKLIQKWTQWWRKVRIAPSPAQPVFYPGRHRFMVAFLSLYFAAQLLVPWRYLLYPGNLFWTEQGYRFSWRVMLMEKSGFITFNIYDPVTGKKEQVRNYDYLTDNQEKMMSTQPDMILQFAHFLKKQYQQKGFVSPVITVDSYVSLNGRRSQPFISPLVNLAEVQESYRPKSWILSFEPSQISKRD